MPTPAVVLELLKPITWFPPMWAFALRRRFLGSGWHGHWGVILTGVLLCGPLLCAASQAVNDWFDRHVDAVNEPGRPIPSGRMPGHWGLGVAILWTLLALLCAAALGTWVLCAAALGLLLAWAYSAPPMQAQAERLVGKPGRAPCATRDLRGSRARRSWPAEPRRRRGPSLIAALYSLGAHGIMTLNDFKSIEGDRRWGVGSLPVRLGAEHAAEVACVAMALPQFVVVAAADCAGARPITPRPSALLLGAQLLLMRRLLVDPRGRAPWYNGTGVSLYVIGMLVSAFALKGIAP